MREPRTMALHPSGIQIANGLRMTRLMPTVLGLSAGAALMLTGAAQLGAQNEGRPTFDVASVKPCRTDQPPDARTGGTFSPGLLIINCQTVKDLIQMAYVAFETGQRVTPWRVTIEGGPAWINSQSYEIRARAEGAESPVM